MHTRLYGHLRVVIAAATLLWASATSAIIDGQVDADNTYSGVGAVIVIRPPENKLTEPVPFQHCTGTLIHPRVMLTAAHCIEPIEIYLAAGWITLDYLRVSFAPNAYDPASWIKMTGYLKHPAYVDHETSNAPDQNDVGVIFLESPATGVPLVRLPGVGMRDQLKEAGELRDHGDPKRFLAVGYGMTLVRSPPTLVGSDGLRRFVWTPFQALRDDWLYVNQNQSLDNGGTCIGDSGGPNYWVTPTGELILVALTSRGNVQQIANSIQQRVDLQQVLDFIASVVASAG
jgi:hypothetical protein